MHLQGTSGGAVGGGVGQYPGCAHVCWCGGKVVVQAPRRLPHRGLGKLGGGEGVCHEVFHGLKRPDGLAELMALAGVLGGEVDHGPGHSHQLGGHRKCHAIEHDVGVSSAGAGRGK